ncbi:aspartate aminotransferase family protein [Kitasatospora sp. SUK 42]|uniref:aspartate aminotransferase family protein n=1 Tax=Kitasatospora sp. SUK 42 TaxID=1588882 RepID=UPI0018CB348C|nr:aminotransferase class III-fold pyridoxal phosphate-dependent enzyme [Kitasatospora sp. SUK 42]MBV2155283.1 aminotransferase class III-fold pyridoxal phosphate-dependent enzyme [Kitasatospora sp. SUK 42]
MNSTAAEPELAEPYLREWLSTVGLDVEYVRAEGNTLYFLDDGREVPVLDYAGGYGSLIFGHNNPEIVAHAKALLDGGSPVHAQFSRHPYANQVATALNRIIHRELGTDEPYSVIFGNSGAEANEAAIKHAELDRVLRIQQLGEELAAHVEQVRAAVADGTARVSGRALAAAGAEAGEDPLEALLAGVARHNAERLARPPLFLALEGSFHGKLVGSVQLTHNAGYRAPFGALAAQARFVPIGRPEELKRIIEEERAELLDLVVTDGAVEVVPRAFPVFCAFLLEPIQGEGGINVITAEFGQAIQQACAEIDLPIVIDEIQSGMGRTGAFLASSLIGLRGDYYTLAKSLGGGIAKTSVMLVRRSRYRREFELVHSSTFAKDHFSCHIALKVLEMLEADDGRAYRTAGELGEKLTAMLEAVRADFPDVVKEIRGKGLMLGLEFHDQSEGSDEGIRETARAGFLGYAVAGYLLREHRVRTFPTASAANTLRFEPSTLISDAEICQLGSALRGVCSVLRLQDGKRLGGA